MHKMYAYSIKRLKKNGVEAINYHGKKIDKSNTTRKCSWDSNIASRTQYYFPEFKRKRYEIQNCDDYQPFRMFLKEELAVAISS